MAVGAVYSLTEGVVSPMVDPDRFYREACSWVKSNVHANERVGLAVSGGIDSTVVARILRDSIGENLHLIHMDHGFMRLIRGAEESDIVAGSFPDYPNMVYRNDVRDRFYRAVAGKDDGEEKRAAFRDVYKGVLNETMEPAGCLWTADGTIKPDIRETRGGIKLQHNVDLGFAQRKLEPLAALSKQEVRALAKHLGIPHLRQPFPGPGLLVRTVGRYSPEKLQAEKLANDRVDQEYDRFMMEYYGKPMLMDCETGVQVPFQTFAATFDYDLSRNTGLVHLENGIQGVRLAANATGLVDDGKTYKRVYNKPFLILDAKGMDCLDLVRAADDITKTTDSSRVLYQLGENKSGGFVVAIRAIDSIDVGRAMPNLFSGVPEHAARRILKEVKGVRSVCFDVTPKPPATVEYE